jgi:hypothetical protein
MLISQQISNSKNFTEVKRIINIVGINMNSDSATLELYYRIAYSKEGMDVSHLFNPQVPNWHIVNSQLMRCRDENFQPIPNPDFVEQKDENGIIINEAERYVTMPAFDYIKMLMLDMNVPMKAIISAYIAEEDKSGRFNF